MLKLFSNNRFIFRIICKAQERLFRITVIPKEIMLEITYRCNLNCSFCFNNLYINKRDKEGELDTDSVKKIIDKISASGVRIIRFTGGEPLLREDIFELMDYAYNRGLKIWLNTNATLVSRKNVNKIVKYVENVLIPVDAFNTVSEEDITGKLNFKKKLKSILLFKKYGIRRLRCGTVATKYNIINLEKIYRLINRLGVHDWELYRVLPISKDDRPLDNEDIRILIDKLTSINRFTKNKYKIANAIPFCSYESEKIKKVSIGAIADDGHHRFVVDSIGRAKPMYYLTENIGNVLNENIMSIWNRGFMRDIRNLKLVPEICKRCRYLRICKGGSRIASQTVGGSYEALDYLAQPYKYKEQLFTGIFL